MEKINIFRRVEWAIEAAKASTTNYQSLFQIENIRWYSEGYAEPGYDDPESGVIACGNWNNISRWDENLRRSVHIDNTVGRLTKVLEQLGCKLEWSDEWSECGDCGKLVRTSPDSWGWGPNYIIQDCELLCIDCSDAESYLEGIEGDPEQITQMFGPDDHGYVLVQDGFEHGFHTGQNADPKRIGKLMRNAGFDRWLFSLDGKGQFDMRFSLWLHEEEAERDDGEGLILAKRVIERGNTDGPSVATAVQRQLLEADRQADALRRDGEKGILVSSVSPTGTSTRVVSAQDFVEGKVSDHEN